MTDYVFSHFLVNGQVYSGSNQLKLTFASPKSVQAIFNEVAPPPPPPTSYWFNVDHSSGGKTIPSTGTKFYAAGTKLRLTATPNRGKSFKYWLVSSVKYYTASVTITINGAGWAYAQFG